MSKPDITNLPDTIILGITAQHLEHGGRINSYNPVLLALHEQYSGLTDVAVDPWGGMVYVNYAGYKLDDSGSTWLLQYWRGGEVGRRRLTMTRIDDWLMQPLGSIEEAKQYDDGIVVLEGDCGGQIFAVIPARKIHCARWRLSQLLSDINEIEWHEDYSSMDYGRLPVGQHVGGGMGGGWVTEDIWVHDSLKERGLEQAIKDVILGKRDRLIDNWNDYPKRNW